MSIGGASSETAAKNADSSVVTSADSKPNMARLYVRGTISNGFGLAIMYALSTKLGLTPFVAIALGIQYAVYLSHGLPNKSEKFYDLSGSFTHLSVVFGALVGVGAQGIVFFMSILLCYLFLQIQIDDLNSRLNFYAISYHHHNLKNLNTQTVVSRSARQLFAAAAAIVWMTRLGTFLYNRILKDGKDGRFDAIKPCWLSFCGAWTVQAVWVTLVEMPVILLCSASSSSGVHAPLTVFDVCCMGGWVLGFLIEACADSQKMQFRSVPENKEKWINSGLWRYSRHPNYFGEILMWCCLAGLSSSVAVQAGNVSNSMVLHFAWLSPLFTAFLLLCVTGVPMVQKAGMKKWSDDADYVAYIENTSCLVPWVPAKKVGAKKE